MVHVDAMSGVPSPTKLLFQQCIQGSEEACSQAFALVQTLFARTARRISFEFGAPDDAEDLVQEMYVKLTSNREGVTRSLPEEEGAVQGYLAIFAANAARDWYRARSAAKRGQAVSDSLDDSNRNIAWALGQPPRVERDVLLAQIEAAVDGDARERLIFRLFYRQGLAASEIAQIPAIGLGTKGVESLLYRMAQRVKQRIAEGKGPTGASL